VNGVEGGDATFKTLPNPTPPLVSDQHATAVTTESVHFSGTINPNGAATTYYFQYGRSSSYGNRTTELTVPAGDPVTVEADVSGLRPYTLYHWRLFARNAAGNTPGRDHTFRTGRLATALTFFSARSHVQYGRGVTLGGRVSGAGVNQMTLALQQERFPFGTGFADVRTTHAGEDGGYLFDIDRVWGLTRFRVVTRTQTPLTSAVVPVRVTPAAGIGVRNLGRKRARISGTLRPAITGELSLQRRLATGRWAQIKHRAITGAKTFSFKVFRARKVTRAYRVVVLPARGAYVKAATRTVFVSRRPARAKGHQAAAS
jgi:Fibronectin type III domain